MNRLSTGCLDSLPKDVARPRYALDAVCVGVVHLGLGAFHRAHQAAYFDARLAAGETDWAICGASLRSPSTQEALSPQDGLYTLSALGGRSEDLRVIGSLRALFAAPSDIEPLLATACDPKVRMVSLTVTEKGYCHDPATCELVESQQDIAHDRGQMRRAALPASSSRRCAADARQASRPSPSSAATICSTTAQPRARCSREWRPCGRPTSVNGCADCVSCPSTMVDRIVPATTDEDRQRIAIRLGCCDAWRAVTEPFTVVEDRFPSGRPRLEESGVTMVTDVAPFELAKLRLLNGSHSTLAYLGCLAGYETVSDAMANPDFSGLVRSLMDKR
jgi:fructuronate reductase